MSRTTMTPGEIRVSARLDKFFNGNKPKRKKEDKPDYLINLSSGKTLGIEIIEFKPILNNDKPYQSVENPIFKLDDELHEKYNNISLKNKDYYVTFFVNNSESFLKDKPIINQILNSKSYQDLIKSNYHLTKKFDNNNKDISNYFEIEKITELTTNYNGLFFLEPIHTVSCMVQKVLVDWLNKFVDQKIKKISEYEKTDLIGLAIEDLYYSNWLTNEYMGTKKRWEFAYNEFLANYKQFILFDYIFVVTKDNVFQIK